MTNTIDEMTALVTLVRAMHADLCEVEIDLADGHPGCIVAAHETLCEMQASLADALKHASELRDVCTLRTDPDAE
jgi:hypothetical protein